MTEAVGAAVQGSPGRGSPNGAGPLFAALDLGTNNCRLLIATPSPRGFRIVDSFSRIVRLGEGLSHSGSLSDDAMERAIGALSVCADRLSRWRVSRVRAVATQACRIAANGPEFVETVARTTGLRLEIISAKEEAQLVVERFWAGALRRAVIEGDVVNGSVMAGQSVGMVEREQPLAEIIAELVDQAVAALLQRSESDAVGRFGHRFAMPA